MLAMRSIAVGIVAVAALVTGSAVATAAPTSTSPSDVTETLSPLGTSSYPWD